MSDAEQPMSDAEQPMSDAEQPMSDARTYFWDFFGPRAQPTAAHFKRHLQGFLDQHGIPDLALVEASAAPNHAAIGVTTPPAHFELIERALRPKRHTVASST